MRRIILLLILLTGFLWGYGQTITASGPTGFCVGGSVTLTITGAPGGSTYQWQQDGNNIPGATSINYTANATAAYSVIVATGSTSTPYGPISVTASSPITPTFISSPTGQCGTVPVNFTNTTGGSGLTYSWNFGDPNSGANNTSQATDPSHAFVGNPGTSTQNFTVMLSASNAGCIRSTTNTVSILQRPGTQLNGTGKTTYDNKPYFVQCVTSTAPFTFNNASSTSATNQSYKIIWGDNTTDFTNSNFTSTTHSYNIGTFTLQFIVNGVNCSDTGIYYVFIGGNPTGSISSPGSTTGCTGSTFNFPFSNISSNPPGTEYYITVDDGSGTSVQYSQSNVPAFFTHTFNKSSCDFSPGRTFTVNYLFRNPCGETPGSIGGIRISRKAASAFSISPSDTVCQTTTVTFTNTGNPGSTMPTTGTTCIPNNSIWQISPATGWTLISGSLGTDNSNPLNGDAWTSGSNSINVNFTTPGTYTIKLKSGTDQNSPNKCGIDSAVRTICVNPTPVAAFSISTAVGCTPLTVTTTNSSNSPICKTNTYQWAVSYNNTSGCTPNSSAFTYLNGTSATSSAPEFQFTNPGVYTISLVTKNSNGLCTSTTVSQTITVKTKPQGSITAPTAVCQNGSISPTAVVRDCYGTTPTTYTWSFPGATPTTSVLANPGSITYNTSGSFVITLDITNECGTTTITKNIAVNPAPDVAVPPNKTLCGGEQTGALIFTSSVAGTTFTWTNSNTTIGLGASGTGSIPNFTVTNNGASAIIATITVTPTSGCSGSPQSFTITVNPRPAKPVVVRPVIYCLNETAVPLSATATTGNTINWYTSFPLSGGSNGAPTPSTTVAGNTTYYAVQNNGICESDTAKIIVTVNPKITGNTVGVDQTLCNGSSAAALTAQATIGGGSGVFQYQWQQSTDGGVTWTAIAGATTSTYNPGVVSGDIKYRRVVASSSCSDTSNVVSITVQGSLTNAGIGIAQTICINTQPDTLRGQLPVGGNNVFTYQWESSPNGTTWTTIAGATGVDYLPPTLATTMYYRRKVSSGQCSVFSSAVQVTVNPKPAMAAVPNVFLCNNIASPVISFSSIPPATSYAWVNDNTTIGLAASGTGSIASFTTINSVKIPVKANIKVAPTFTANNVGCVGDTIAFTITVLPTITVSPIASLTKCTGENVASFTPVADTVSFPGSSLQYSWTVTGSGVTLTSGIGSSIPSYNTINTGTADLVATITVTPKYTFNGKTCDGTPSSYTVTVKSATANANAGIDQTLCAQTTVSLSSTFVNGTTGVWSQVGTTATITSPSATNTTVTGLLAGTVYKFVWTQTGFASCPATTDTVVIDNKTALVNKIDTVTKTICAGNTLNIAGQFPAGGGSTYSYQWEQSIDGINYTPITAATLQNITITPTATTWLRRFVNALPCTSYSDTAKIIVQPALANNNISADQTICTGVVSASISGTIPTGGNGAFSYVWEQSINGGSTWTTLTGATGNTYSPGAITQTTKYRRIVSTTLCSGPFGSTSNVITITVNPDAKALFLPTDTIKCAPFVITPAIINLQTSPANNQYLWYGNGNLIGSGTTFPGYTIANENDSVIIKLAVISTFGCKNDSLSKKFKTIKRPTPSFTLSDTVGCGPITITATNTSTYITEFNYFWDFGNGQTSTAIQPPAIVFAPNPAYGDTTYIVKLKVFSICDTLTFSRSMRVKSKPKALFTPSKTTGCSPMVVTFRNTSKGTNNTYTWNFGDGTTFSTTSIDSVQHTFITGVVDTFYVKLKAVNECGADSIIYSIIVAPNTIRLNLAVNGTDRFGCAPHAVPFVNNSQGASVFNWNFGDGASTTTTKNIDTVYHTYLTAGTYTVTLRAVNNCSDTTTTTTITVYPKPRSSFNASAFNICRGDTVRFTNLSDSATAYLWKFGDGGTSILMAPSHIYTTPGSYIVTLIAYRNNASGNSCIDSMQQTITVTATQTGFFTASDTTSACAPLTVTFVNKNKPSVTTGWDFGDGTTGTGDSVVHTFTLAGTYTVKLTATVPGGCTYITTKTITVNGPKGTLLYNGGFVCSSASLQLQAVATGATSYLWDFGDGNTLTTTQQTVFHFYTNPGFYLPKVSLQNAAGCSIVLKGIDTVKVDRVDGGFTIAKNEQCGFTSLTFTDTSHVFFGRQSIRWNFGDNTNGTGPLPTHTYTAGGTYIIQMIVISNSGCTDTVTKQIAVLVKSKPVIGITAIDTACTRRSIQFNSIIQSTDAINVTQWNVSNGASGTGATFNYTFTQTGTYTIRLIVGTVNGCYDTAFHTITINPSPTVIATPSFNLCRGNTAQLNVSGAASYQWLPLQGLSCYTCSSPIASPTVTTPYVVQGKNSFGCPDWDTVVITVIQPLRMNVSPSDSICIGESTNLLASGASSYNWSPAIGLNNTTISNPTASPTVTTTYRVVGYDGYNCFTDTAFITVGVGPYPTINLGPDLTLGAGTLHPLTSTITNGPITKWVWTPTTNLSCSNCAVPVAEIKKNISYAVIATTAYGCSASDTIKINVTCSEDQVFIPNAFSPDGDGMNDVLMVRARGIVSVKYFRIFNRWGEMVFERSNFKANDPLNGWDGRVKGTVGGPDVFVYTCEAMCENGAVFTYKGNVTLVK